MNVLDDYLLSPEISLPDKTRIQAQVADEHGSGKPELGVIGVGPAPRASSRATAV